MFAQKYPLNVHITFEYTETIGVHGFVDFSNRKCDLGSFPLGSVLGPSGNILPFLSPRLTPHTYTPSASSWISHPPGISSDPPSGGMDIFWNYTMYELC